MPKILIIEPDQQIACTIDSWMRSDGNVVEHAATGRDALVRLQISRYEVIILASKLPDMRGTDVLVKFRSDGGETPVIVISERVAPQQKELVLDLGADDYITKPFEMIELAARIRALLRRQKLYISDVLEAGHLKVNTANRQVFSGARPVRLAPLEFNLLVFFLRNPDRIFSPDDLSRCVWKCESAPTIESIRTCVKSLRRKTSTGKESLIRTVHGIGYFLDKNSISFVPEEARTCSSMSSSNNSESFATSAFAVADASINVAQSA